jgi:hypothetical protein
MLFDRRSAIGAKRSFGDDYPNGSYVPNTVIRLKMISWITRDSKSPLPNSLGVLRLAAR